MRRHRRFIIMIMVILFIISMGLRTQSVARADSTLGCGLLDLDTPSSIYYIHLPASETGQSTNVTMNWFGVTLDNSVTDMAGSIILVEGSSSPPGTYGNGGTGVGTRYVDPVTSVYDTVSNTSYPGTSYANFNTPLYPGSDPRNVYYVTFTGQAVVNGQPTFMSCYSWAVQYVVLYDTPPASTPTPVPQPTATPIPQPTATPQPVSNPPPGSSGGSLSIWMTQPVFPYGAPTTGGASDSDGAPISVSSSDGGNARIGSGGSFSLGTPYPGSYTVTGVSDPVYGTYCSLYQWNGTCLQTSSYVQYPSFSGSTGFQVDRVPVIVQVTSVQPLPGGPSCLNHVGYPTQVTVTIIPNPVYPSSPPLPWQPSGSVTVTGPNGDSIVTNLTNGTATVQFTDLLAAGTYPFTAQYTGDGYYYGNSGVDSTVPVVKTQPILQPAVADQSVAYGQGTVITWQVLNQVCPNIPRPTQTVTPTQTQISQDGATQTMGATATLTLAPDLTTTLTQSVTTQTIDPATIAGLYLYLATYSGDFYYTPASFGQLPAGFQIPVTTVDEQGWCINGVQPLACVQIQRIAPIVGVSVPSNILYGQDAPVFLSISGSGPASPTGQIVVYNREDEAGSITVGPLSNGGVLTLSHWDAGSYTLQVLYNGDNNYLPATTSTSLVMHPIPITMQIIPSLSPVQAGQHVWYYALITVPADTPSWVVPMTGLVLWKNNGNDAVFTTVYPGATTQTYITEFLYGLQPAQGTTQIQANYSGDQRYAPLTATYAQVVGADGSAGTGASMRYIYDGSIVSVDVHLDGVLLDTNVGDRTISSYLPIATGTHTLSLTSASSPLLFGTLSFTIQAGQMLTILIGGNAGSATMTTIVDTPILYPDGTSVRVYNLDTADPSVSIAGGALSGVTIPAYGASAYIDQPEGAYSYIVLGDHLTTAVSLRADADGTASIVIYPNGAAILAPPVTSAPAQPAFQLPFGLSGNPAAGATILGVALMMIMAFLRRRSDVIPLADQLGLWDPVALDDGEDEDMSEFD